MSGHHCYNSHPSDNFYQQYMQHFAIMDQFFQQLTQSTSAVPLYNASHTCQCHCHCQCQCHCHCPCHSSVNSTYRVPPVDIHPTHRVPSADYATRLNDGTSSSDTSSSTTGSSSEDNSEEEESHEDDDEPEHEYELNVEAFVAMRAAKRALQNSEKKSSASSSDNSTPVVDSDKEEFDFVDYGGYNAPAATSGVPYTIDGSFNKKEELENKKKIMNYLYGEKSATIGGMETVMAINFERLCDIHQPGIWPVLPVRL